MALKSCWVVRSELADNLVNADVTPRKTDVGAGFDTLSGMSEDQIRAEEQAIQQRPLVTNEVYERGLKLTLRMADTGNEFSRFLSLGDLDEMVFGRRFEGKTCMTEELALQFGQMLMQRKQPITIGIMDSNVELDDVKRFTEDKPDALRGTDRGISSIPREPGRR